MTIVPPINPISPVLKPFPWDAVPYTNVTPLTIRDNATMQWETEKIKQWIREDLVPHTDTEFAKLVESWVDNAHTLWDTVNQIVSEQATNVNEALDDQRTAVNTALETQQNLVSNALAQQLATVVEQLATQNDAIEEQLSTQDASVASRLAANLVAINDAVQQVINSSIQVSDPVIMGVVNNSNTNFRKYLDAQFIRLAPGLDPTGVADNGALMQTLINSYTTAKKILEVPPGIYNMGTVNIGLPAGARIRGVASGTSRFSGGTDGVELKWSNQTVGACVTVNAGNVWLENLKLNANGANAVGILSLGGFEGRFHTVRIMNAANIGHRIRAISNTSYREFYVDNCGTATLPAVLIDSVSHSLNTLDFENVHIERQVNTALHIGPMGDIGDGTGHIVPEFLRLTNLHVEAVGDNGGTYNAGALVKVALSRNVVLVNCFLLGGPGPVLEHAVQQGTIYDGVSGGLSIVGGTIRGQSGANMPVNLIVLTTGTGFSTVGGKFDNCSGSQVLIAQTYGQQAYIGDTTVFTAGGPSRVTDNRTVRQALRKYGDVTFDGHVSSNNGAPTVKAGAQAGANAPAPTLFRADDTKGIIFCGTGDTPTAGALCTLTFAKPFNGQPIVTLTPANPAAADFLIYVASTTTTLTIFAKTAPGANKPADTYQFQYHVWG